jgi:hypothetical protein
MTSNTRAFGPVVALALALLALPAAAGASDAPTLPTLTPQIFPSVTTTLVAGDVAHGDCLHRLRTGAGIARTTFTAPADGQLTAQLRGTGFRNDWDLAAFAADGRRLEGSGSFFANEVVKPRLRRGERVTIQACRLDGRARSMPLRTTFVAVPRVAAAPLQASFVKVRVLGRTEYDRLEALAGTTGLLDITHDVQNGRAMVIAFGPGGLEKLRSGGFVFEVVDDDMAATFRTERAKDRAATRALGAEGSPLPSGRTEYRTIEDYYAELKQLVADNPTLVKPVELKGKTFEGRDLVAVEIAADVTTPAEGRPYFVLNAMHHAREWPSAETSMEFALDLVKSYKAGDPRVTKLLQTTRVIVQPMTNVDGYNNSRQAMIDEPTTGVAPGPGANAYRRKNCNFPFPAVVPCELQLGVDVNRNYPESWGGPGASSTPVSQTYRGPSPGSEPETAAVRELVSKVQATSLLTIHNVAALVLRPPGLETDGFAPDEAELKRLGDKMGRATGYTSQYGWELYDTTGTTDDWSYSATGGFGYTIEVGPPGGGFHMAYQTGVIDEYFGTDKYKGKGLREAYLLAAEHAAEPTASGRIVGRAPAGRTLRLKKQFATESQPVCAIAEATPLTGDSGQPDYCAGPGAVQTTPETLDTTITVPASGRFTYWTNPSTRPFVKKAGKTEAWTLTCEDTGKVVETHQVTIDRGQVVTLDLPCGGTLVDDAKPAAKKKAKKKTALQKCLAKADKKKQRSARAKARKACKKRYGRSVKRK